MAPTPGITTRSPQTINPLTPEDRQTIKAEAKTAVSTLASDVASAPLNRPTDQTSADTRRALSYDPRTQQLIARTQGQVPTATNEDGTVTITGTPDNDRIRIQQNEDQIQAYYTDENDEEQLLGEWNADEVERIEVAGDEGDDVLIGENLDGRFTLNGGEGDDQVVNHGEGEETSIDSATLEGGEGDDQLINTRTGATLHGGEGANEIVNSGDLSIIGDEGEDVDSEDFVFNAADGAEITYQNDGAHQIQSVGDDNRVDTNSEDGTVNVAGDFNQVTLNGQGNNVTVQGDNNVARGTTGGNTVAVAGTGNGVDLIGTGNTVDINGDSNVVATDNAAGILLDNFDQLDADGDGYLLPEEIAQVPGAEDIAANADSLIFANIDGGSNAWHGVSREDLQLVADRMYQGETLDQISQDLMESSWLGQRITEGGKEITPETFSEEVNRYRMDNPRPDVDPLTLAPLLDINQIGVWGDMNLVAAPGPGTVMAFDGDANQLNVGGNSAVAGNGWLNEINLGGQNTVLGFQGSGNEVNSGGGNAILGTGDYNTINSEGWDLIQVDGWNEINQPQIDFPTLQTALSPYFADMAPGGLDSETLIALMLQQGQGTPV